MGNGMDLTKDEVFKLGMEAGRKLLMDHIQHQFKAGKPVEINGELYWLKDAGQNLMDIMDEIESAWNEGMGVKSSIVPIRKRSFNNKEVTREIIIQAETAEMAGLIAVEDFQHDGWAVDMDYGNYRKFRR